MQERRAVDRGGRGAGGCESSPSLGHVSESVVDTGLEELDLDKDELVIQSLELLEQAIDEGEGVVVGLLLHVKGDEARLEVLAEEAALLRVCPVDARLCDGDLGFERVGDGVEEVEKLADFVGGDGSIARPQRARDGRKAYRAFASLPLQMTRQPFGLAG